jgi:hypothetical protein
VFSRGATIDQILTFEKYHIPPMSIRFYPSPFLLDAVPSFCSGEYWTGAIQNSIGCTLGSLLAILAAYLVYLATTEGARKEQDRQEADLLFHFKLSIKSVMAIVRKQTSNIEEYCTAIDKRYYPDLQESYCLGRRKSRRCAVGEGEIYASTNVELSHVSIETEMYVHGNPNVTVTGSLVSSEGISMQSGHLTVSNSTFTGDPQ